MSRARMIGGAAAVAFALLPAAPAPAAVSTFVSGNTLEITGDGAADRITLSNVDGGQVLRVTHDDGFSLTARSSFVSIDIDAGDGNDTVTFDEAAGVFANSEVPTVRLGGGDDTLNGAFAKETVVGGDGNDTILASGGDDVIFGNEGNDVIESGRGRDTVDAGGGDDTVRAGLVDGADTIIGAGGSDRLLFTGTSEGDTIDLGPVVGSPGHVLLDSPGNARHDITGVEAIDIDGGSGGETVRVAAIFPASIALSVDTGKGRDEITTGPGADTIAAGQEGDVVDAGAGDDTIDGVPGGDTLTGGPGADGVTGGTEPDVFECGDGDTVFDLEATDVARGNCLAPPPPAPPVGDPPAAPQQPGGQVPGPAVPPLDIPAPGGLPAGFLGFAKPKVQVARTGLKVTIRNTHTAPIRVKVAGSEKRGRRKQRYRTATKVIAPGKLVTVTLRATRAYLRARGKRRASVTVTNVATSGKVTLRR